MAKEMGQRLRLIALLQQLVSQTSKPTDDHDRGQSRVIQVMSGDTDNSFMRRAIAVAITDPQYPFGAVIVDNTSEVIVAEGDNQSDRNPILHGEMDAINNYAASGGTGWRRLTFRRADGHRLTDECGPTVDLPALCSVHLDHVEWSRDADL